MADPETVSSYARLAIAKDQKQIRLLKLLPSVDTDEISCTLEVVNWTPELQYAAISYVWGDPTIKKTISVNDQPFHITENLHTALWHIRKNDMLRKDGSEQPLPLWADAVCIDQDNIEERNHQVSLMGSIYGSASKVIYWLGRFEDGNLSGDAAITAIQEMTEAAFHDGSDLDTDSLKNYLAAHKGFSIPKTTKDNPGPLEFSDLPPIWQSILHISFLEFWERIWIVQEIALPVSESDLWFTCGSSTTTWTRFLQFDRMVNAITSGNSLGLQEFFPSTLTTMLSSNMTVLIFALRRFRERNKPLGPGNLPAFATMYKATNPLDYIYGFRAVIHIQPVVNYDKSKQEVYMDWFKDAMQYSPTSIVMGFAGIGWHGSANQKWPSWLPDLASIQKGPAKLVTRINLRDGPDSQQPSGDIDGSVLHIPGVRLRDTIAKVFELETGAPKQELGSSIHYVCFSILANASKHHPLGVTPLHAFLITLVNCFMDKPSSKLSFEHPLDTNDPLLAVIITVVTLYDRNEHPRFRYDDYLSTYGQGWVSMGFRDGHDLMDSLREHFLGDLPLSTVQRLEPTLAHINAASLLNQHLLKHATFQTTDGHIGIGPPGIKEGDELCFFSGHASPMLLRLEEENDSMVTKFVGLCYIHKSSVAVMKDSVASGSAKEERFSLH